MKKTAVFALVLGLILNLGVVFAESASVEERLAAIVMEYLDASGYTYEYDADDESISLTLALDCDLGYTDVTFYLYDDMVSLTADSPFEVEEEDFEKMAVFIAMANNEMYYGQFRVDRDFGLLSCRSFQLAESVLPGTREIGTLMDMTLHYMELYGDSIAAIENDGADPYEAFADCQAEME